METHVLDLGFATEFIVQTGDSAKDSVSALIDSGGMRLKFMDQWGVAFCSPYFSKEAIEGALQQVNYSKKEIENDDQMVCSPES